MADLVEDGRLRWDQPVQDILPQSRASDPALSQTITVENLVCACWGVPRRDLEFLFNAESLDAEKVIASLADFPSSPTLARLLSIPTSSSRPAAGWPQQRTVRSGGSLIAGSNS